MQNSFEAVRTRLLLFLSRHFHLPLEGGMGATGGTAGGRRCRLTIREEVEVSAHRMLTAEAVSTVSQCRQCLFVFVWSYLSNGPILPELFGLE